MARIITGLEQITAEQIIATRCFDPIIFISYISHNSINEYSCVIPKFCTHLIKIYESMPCKLNVSLQ